MIGAILFKKEILADHAFIKFKMSVFLYCNFKDQLYFHSSIHMKIIAIALNYPFH